MRVITVSAICFERADGAVLTVRKRGTTSWMLPGGKPESGESAGLVRVATAAERQPQDDPGEEQVQHAAGDEACPRRTFEPLIVGGVPHSALGVGHAGVYPG